MVCSLLARHSKIFDTSVTIILSQYSLENVVSFSFSILQVHSPEGNSVMLVVALVDMTSNQMLHLLIMVILIG